MYFKFVSILIERTASCICDLRSRLNGALILFYYYALGDRALSQLYNKILFFSRACSVFLMREPGV